MARKQFSSPDRAPACWRRVVAGRFHFGGASRPQLRWSTTARWVGNSVIAARSTLSKTTRALNMLKGTDRQHAGAIAFLVRVFGSRSTAGRVATPQDLSVTKQHRNDRWDRCTASAGDWQIITTTSHRSANQRYFMHNSATVHRMRMQSWALDSSRSQLCNDTSTGVVRHQITKWRRLQKVVSYDVLHHRNLILVRTCREGPLLILCKCIWLRPAGGVKHSDSDLVETRMLSAKKALR